MPEFHRVTAQQRRLEKSCICFGAAFSILIGAFAYTKDNTCVHAENINTTTEYYSSPKGAVIAINDIFEEDKSADYGYRTILLEDTEASIDAAEDTTAESESSYDSLYSQAFYDVNDQLYAYTSKYATFTFHDVTLDGLAVMAQANTESYYMCDPSISISAIYPSRWLDMKSLSDIESCNCAYVWAWGGLDSDVKAWSTGDGVNEQGPLQQRVTQAAEAALPTSGSEYDIIKYSGLYDDIAAKCPEILYNCTGSNNKPYNNVGDRFNIRDNCIIWKTAKEDQLEVLWDRYYSNVNYTPNLYEYLAISAYSHWIPGVIAGDNADYYYFGFGYSNAWFDIAHALSSDEAIAVIRDKVRADIDSHREKYYEGELSAEDTLKSLQLVLYNSVDETGLSEPGKIWKQLTDMGILSSDMVISNCGYGYDHARNYAIQYLYAYVALEELLINRY